MTPEQYLATIVPTREKVAEFLTKAGADGLQPNRGWYYDAELGWVHVNARHVEPRYGVNKAVTYCSYEPFGARKVLNSAGAPCRIHTYGDSFTHCDQVNDGETWQEYLAAHLLEPVYNFGVGGYSVYQAYRRMVKIHRDTDQRATHVILNIFEDDHYRNLDPWRSIRCVGRSSCGYTLPYLEVDPASGTCVEHENICDAPEKVYQLCDEKYVVERFGKHYTTVELVEALNAMKAEFGTDTTLTASSDISRPEYRYAQEARMKSREKLADRALLSTRFVVEKVERFAAKHGMRLMVMLSFGQRQVESALSGKPQFDASLVEWLKTRGMPVVDMRAKFRAAHERSGGKDVTAFLNPYFIGHQSPAGNFFTAWSMMDEVVKWLEPGAAAYR